MKRILSVLMAVMLVLSLAGCGQSTNESTSEEKTEVSTSEQEVQSTESTTGGDTIKLGYIYDASGANATTQNITAVKLAVEEINNNGGVLGKQIELIAVDGESDTQRAQEMAKKLCLEDQVDVLFSSGNSAMRESIRPMAEKNQMLYFYTNSYEGGVASHYTFCLGGVPDQQVKPLVKYALENKGKKIYIIAADYNYGQIMALWVKKYAEEFGGEIVGEEFIPLADVSQYSSSIQKIEESGADLVFTAMVGSTQLAFFEQWATANVEGITLMSAYNFASTYDHIRVNSKALAGSLTCAPFMEEFDTESGKKFVEAYRSFYADEPYITANCNSAYGAVYLWAEAVEQAGTTDVETVIATLETGNVSAEAPSGTITMDGKSHQLIQNISLVEINEDLKAEVIETEEAVRSTFLEDLGIDLTKEAPNKQFDPLTAE